jgi:hypothetical protein
MLVPDESAGTASPRPARVKLTNLGPTDSGRVDEVSYDGGGSTHVDEGYDDGGEEDNLKGKLSRVAENVGFLGQKFLHSRLFSKLISAGWKIHRGRFSRCNESLATSVDSKKPRSGNFLAAGRVILNLAHHLPFFLADVNTFACDLFAVGYSRAVTCAP